MLRSVRAWIERLPIEDPVQRDQAATVQVLCLIAIAWVAAVLIALALKESLLENAFDVGVLLFGNLPALSAAVVLLRRGASRSGSGERGSSGTSAIRSPCWPTTTPPCRRAGLAGPTRSCAASPAARARRGLPTLGRALATRRLPGAAFLDGSLLPGLPSAPATWW